MENSTMKIALITVHTPTIENMRGASALPFHLILNCPKNIVIKIYSYNINKVAPEQILESSKLLNSEICVIKQSFFRLLCFRLFFLLRACLPYPLLHYLKLPLKIQNEIHQKYDKVWIYGEDIGKFANMFKKKMCVVTTPDCEALYYRRILDIPSKLNNYYKILRYSRAYWQYINIAKTAPTENVIYHLVGKEDMDFLKAINPAIKAQFIPHPHYDGNVDRIVQFTSPKIRLLMPGRYDFYSAEAVDDAIQAMSQHPKLSKYYRITFQGKNWESSADKLRKAGYDVEMKGFVPCYKDELCQHDIQLSPICLGTGTKGKVLDAFINGLMVIAPIRAIENICVSDKEEYMFYSSSKDLIDILFTIPDDIHHYEQIAKNGQRKVLCMHNAKQISIQFFDLFIKK